MEALTKNLFGKLFGDKGYVSQKLFEKLWEKDMELITNKRKNEKNPKIMPYSYRILLRKHAMIEFVNDFLKNTCQIEHSRHRNCCNFVVNLMSGFSAYSFLPKNLLFSLKVFLLCRFFIELTLFK